MVLWISKCHAQALRYIENNLWSYKKKKSKKKKDQSSDAANANNYDAGKFTLDESLIFVLGIIILLLQLTAPVVSLLKLQPPAHDGHGSVIGEVLYINCVVVALLLAIFERIVWGIRKAWDPKIHHYKSVALALLFLHLCRRTTMGWDFVHAIIIMFSNNVFKIQIVENTQIFLRWSVLDFAENIEFDLVHWSPKTKDCIQP